MTYDPDQFAKWQRAQAKTDDAWIQFLPRTEQEALLRRYKAIEKAIGDALYVEYASGGATPGDGYLWHLDSSGRPTRWQMWVSVLPIGGLEASWARWETTSEGVAFATEHELGPLGFEVTNIRTAASAAELAGGDDPFAPLE